MSHELLQDIPILYNVLEGKRRDVLKIFDNGPLKSYILYAEKEILHIKDLADSAKLRTHFSHLIFKIRSEQNEHPIPWDKVEQRLSLNVDQKDNLDVRTFCLIHNSTYLVKGKFTLGHQIVKPNTIHILQTTLPLPFYVLCTDDHIPEGCFSQRYQYKYKFSFLEPHKLHYIPENTQYVIVTNTKNLFSIHVTKNILSHNKTEEKLDIKETLEPEIKQKQNFDSNTTFDESIIRRPIYVQGYVPPPKKTYDAPIPADFKVENSTSENNPLNLSLHMDQLESLDWNLQENENSRALFEELMKNKMETAGMNSLSGIDISRFLEVYGNSLEGNTQYLLALKFKKPVIKYHANFIRSPIIEIPEDSVLVLVGNVPFIKGESSLIFTQNNSLGVQVSRTDTRALLTSLIPQNMLIASYFALEVLYVITTHNPFATFFKKNARNAAFRALQKLITATLFERRLLNYEEMAMLRYFQKGTIELRNFKSWSQLAVALAYSSYHRVFEEHLFLYDIFPNLSEDINRILQNTRSHSNTELPGPDFYECEILYTTTEPVGILYKIEENEVLYVSPMVVTHPPTFPFKDCNRINCNCWVPLYKDHRNWVTFCMRFYFAHYYKKMHDLKLILMWLHLQTVEKYKYIYNDLKSVGKILLGENHRWFLNRN